MSIITKKGRQKPYYYSFSTGELLPDGNYKRIYSTVGYATKKEAQAAEVEAKQAYNTGTYIEPIKMTVGEMLDAFYDTKIELRESTLTQYRCTITRIKKHPLADRPLQKATVLDVESLRKHLYDRMERGELAQNTIREDLSFLRSAFTWASDVDLIYKSPARRLKLPPKSEPQGIHTPIENVMEILKIVKSEAYPDLYLPLLLASFCGLRISEICGVQRNKISPEEISITNNLSRRKGKLRLAELKTKTSERNIPLLQYAKAEINEYIKYIDGCQREAKRKRWEQLRDPQIEAEYLEPAWKNDYNLLYVFPDDGRPHSKDYVEKRWRDFKKKNKYINMFFEDHPELRAMRLHDFRHSFGSNLRDQGVSVEDICELLGHSDAEFTRHTYALPLKGTHQKAIDFYENKIVNLL